MAHNVVLLHSAASPCVVGPWVARPGTAAPLRCPPRGPTMLLLAFEMLASISSKQAINIACTATAAHCGLSDVACYYCHAVCYCCMLLLV